MSKNSLELHLPDLSAAAENSFATSPEEVKTWLERLPLADAGESARQIFEAVFELNRLHIPALARIKIAELFLQPLAYLSKNLGKFYLESSFPLSKKSRKIALLDRELHAELAISYKLVIDRLTRGRRRRSDLKVLVIAIHRAISLLSRVLYRSVIVYEPYPQGTWREIHRLYAYAEQKQILDVPVKEAEENSENATIGSLYRRILLFSISSPYRLRQQEIEYVQSQLPAWEHLTSLGKVKPHPRSNGLFIASLDADQPPCHLDLIGPEEKDRRELNTQRLALWLRKEFDNLPRKHPAGGKPGIDEQTLKQLTRRMIQAFNTMRKRKYLRTTLNSELTNVVGLSALHAILSASKSTRVEATESLPSTQEQEFDWFDPPLNRPLISTLLYTSRESAAYTLMHREPNEQTEGEPTQVVLRGPGGTNQASFRAMDSEEQMAEPFSCATVNQSASGYCIRWQGGNTPRLRVGEILGIRSASDDNLFNIGVSRWLKYIPGEGLTVGMELISPGAVPAVARPVDTSGSSESPRECLILPALRTAKQPASLILHALHFQTGDLLEISDDSEERQVLLTQLLETTGNFAQFRFVYLDRGGHG